MSALAHHLGDCLIERIGKPDVAHDAAVEKGEWADALGAVDDLVWDDEVARLDVLLQRADGGEGDDAAHAEGAERRDVGAVRDLMGRERVVCAVAREEGNHGVAVGEDGDRGGGGAPRCRNVQGGDWGVALELLEASAADDGDVDFALTVLDVSAMAEERCEGSGLPS